MLSWTPSVQTSAVVLILPPLDPPSGHLTPPFFKAVRVQSLSTFNWFNSPISSYDHNLFAIEVLQSFKLLIPNLIKTSSFFNVCICKFLVIELGGVFKKLLPRKEYFSQALYTFDIGQNDLTTGLKLNMTTDQIKAYIPDVLDQFSNAIRVSKDKVFIHLVHSCE